jgi:hypothetical protein
MSTERLQLQRESGINADMEAFAVRLTHDRVDDEETFDRLFGELEKSFVEKYGVMEMEMDGHPIHGDQAGIYIKWDPDARGDGADDEDDEEIEDDDEYTILEFSIGYDEETTSWSVDDHGWTQ